MCIRDRLDYGTLCKKTDEVTARFHELSNQIKAAETRMAEIAVMKKHIINYAKTRDVYVAYRKAGYSKKFLADHESDILLHKAAKKAFDEMGIKKLPTFKSLQAEYAELLAEKKKLPFLTFEGEELMKVQGDFTPSAFVKSVTGADNVCERSAVLGAAKGKLIKRKSGGDGVTTALALREWEVHFE